MALPKRKRNKTKPEDMINVNTEYVRAICHDRGFNMSETSVKLGYCPEYISNSIADGRMRIELLKWLSVSLDFPYKDAVVKSNVSVMPW